MRDSLKKEKELRKKGFADKQIEETVAFLRQKGVETVWDVQAAYDSGLFGLTERCSFGSHGLCCRNCNLGPCRLDGEDIPFHGRNRPRYNNPYRRNTKTRRLALCNQYAHQRNGKYYWQQADY